MYSSSLFFFFFCVVSKLWFDYGRIGDRLRLNWQITVVLAISSRLTQYLEHLVYQDLLVFASAFEYVGMLRVWVRGYLTGRLLEWNAGS